MSALMGRIFVTLASLVMLMPTASAWSLPQDPPELSAPIAAWTWDLSPQAETQRARDAAACAMGDVDADGVHDILVRVKDKADAPPRIVALAGPDFSRPIWQVATKADRILQCAPDLNKDGVSDPVTVIANAATSASTPGAAQGIDRAMQVVDGSTGEVLIKRQHKDTNQGTKAAGVSASSNVTADMMPAAAGAEAFVKTEVQQSAFAGLPAALPMDQVTATPRRAAEMSLLDAQGTVQGVITIDEPGVDPLAMAPIPVGQGLPDVGVLTAKAASPVEEATQRVPSLSRFNPDGTLAWARELEGTQALPMLVPRAGDLDMDGVQDMIVQNVPAGLATGATSQFQVLSGIDGKTLLRSGPPVNGLAAALPLGRLPDGASGILAVTQADATSKLTLRALDVAGGVMWTVEVDPGSVPINVRPDAYTGDPLGFTDLTGDGLPDVGVASRQGSDLVLKAVSGANGSIAWSLVLPDAQAALPISPLATLGQVRSTAANIPSDILVIANTTKSTGMSLVDGQTGKIVWTLKGALPAGAAMAAIDVQAAGDLDADGVQDLLATVTAGAGGKVSGGMESSSASAGGGSAVYAVSGEDGKTLWSNSTDGSGAPNELTAQTGEGYEDRAEKLEEGEAKRNTPAPTVFGVGFAALVAVLVLRGRRR